MFSLKVTEDEIQDTLETLELFAPDSAKLPSISWVVYENMDEISKRKVRLCIAALREKGHLIIATNQGYMLAGDDPEQVIHFINGLYSRAHKLTKEADTMFHQAKLKYGSELSEKVKVNPDQPALLLKDVTQADIDAQHDRMNGEPAFQKEYDSDGTLHNV